jgi:hypothetical protein
MKKRTQIFSVFSIIFLFLASSAAAQDFWMQRSYKRWTKDEIIKLISDSPWAQVRELEASTTEGGFTPQVTIRLRSAVPVRQALVRLKQIEANYDKLDAPKRAEFDEKMKGTLDCPACQENYVVTISPPISKITVTSGVYGLKSATLKLLQGKVYLLNDRGEKRELVHFVAPKNDADEATFFFARKTSDGKPFLTKENAKFTFVFEAENIPIRGSEVKTGIRVVGDGTTPVIETDSTAISKTGRTVPRRVDFDVKRILIDEIPEF